MDGSTKFGANNRYGYFPSFSLGWNIKNESFMANSVFSALKLRGGWGMTGNQEIEPKSTQELLQPSNIQHQLSPVSNRCLSCWNTVLATCKS